MTDALGDQLRRLRESRGMSAQALSDASGVSLRTIYRIERGEQRNPRKVTLRAMFRALTPPVKGSDAAGELPNASGSLGVEDHLAAIVSHIEGLRGPNKIDFIRGVSALLDGLEHADAGAHPHASGEDDK